MYYHQNLRVQLQERRNRLHKANHQSYQTELRYFLTFIDKTPYLYALTQELETYPGGEGAIGYNVFRLPEDETSGAKFCYGLMKECVIDSNAAWRYGSDIAPGGSNLDASVAAFTREIVDRFVNHLHARLDEGSSVLYLLEKYKRRTEWFHRTELLQQMEQDPKHSEAAVDAHLREYLFDQGIDYPFSSPSSPSGRADVVADIGEDRPLVMEVKLFDPARSYDRGYIRQGFRQVHDYAVDYGQSVGYLVIFNCSLHTLVFETGAETKLWPPRVELDYRTFFLVVIDLMTPEDSASKRPPLQPYIIRREDLVARVVEPGEASTSTP